MFRSVLKKIHGTGNRTLKTFNKEFIMGQQPSFITGANAKIQLAGKTIAYAQDVSYTVDVTHIPIEVMGRYEVVSNEPVAYFVNGSLSVIRYTSIAKTMDGAAQSGNASTEWGDAGTHIDPSKFLMSETFDLFVMQKSSDSTATIDTTTITLYDCRFVRKGAGINKRGILVDMFTFNARFHSDSENPSTTTSGSFDTDLSA
jgi:hypothetical protein